MRSLQLLRSRTNNDNLGISIEQYQSPIILYNQSGYNIDDAAQRAEAARLNLAVTFNSRSPKQIGGLSLMRKVLLKRRIPNSKKWGEWETVQTEKAEVVGNCEVLGGQRFECSLPLPHGVPESRQTYYDQVVHVISAIVHDLAPSYLTTPAQLRIANVKQSRAQSSAPPSSGRDIYHSSSTSRRLRSSPLHPSSDDQSSDDGPSSRAPVPMEGDLPFYYDPASLHVNKHHDILASCSQIYEVARCPTSQGDVPMLEWGESLRLADSGKVNVKASSDLFVLGSRIDFSVDFESLTPDTTVHAISAKLIQETATPVKTALPDLTSPTTQTPSRTLAAPSPGDGPSPDRRSRSAVFSRLSTFWINLKEKPPLPETSILDEFLLFTEGEDHIIVSDGFQHRQGSSLWRGEAGRIIDSEHRDPDHVAEHPETVYLDDSKASHTASESIERTTSTMKLHRRVRLPSEVNDAHSSSSTLSPALAKVTHRVEIDVIYSILGQDQRGKPITSDNNNGRSAQEGSVRLVRGLFEIDLASCSITRSIIQPPSYPSPAIATPHMTSLHRRLSTASTVTRMIPTPFSPVMPHTRAFRASNHRTVGSKVIFYEEAHVREALERHRSERPDCACRLWDGSRESERLDRWISGSA